MKLEELINKKAELQIAPLIDVVFLLLIYFMVTASLIRQEADLSFILPAKVDQIEPIAMPIEVLIEVDAVGDVVIEGMVFGKDPEAELDDLILQLIMLREAAEASMSPFIVNIMPEDTALHWRIVQVMDACHAAEVKNVSFSMTM